MSTFIEISGKYIVIMAILLSIVVNLKWFKKKNDSSGKNRNNLFRIIKVTSVLFLIVYIASDLPNYITELEKISGGSSLFKALVFHFK